MANKHFTFLIWTLIFFPYEIYMFLAKFAEKVQNLQKKCKAYKKAGKFTWKIAHFKEKNEQNKKWKVHMTLIHVITLRWKITLSNSKNDQYFFFYQKHLQNAEIVFIWVFLYTFTCIIMCFLQSRRHQDGFTKFFFPK